MVIDFLKGLPALGSSTNVTDEQEQGSGALACRMNTDSGVAGAGSAAHKNGRRPAAEPTIGFGGESRATLVARADQAKGIALAPQGLENGEKALTRDGKSCVDVKSEKRLDECVATVHVPTKPRMRLFTSESILDCSWPRLIWQTPLRLATRRRVQNNSRLPILNSNMSKRNRWLRDQISAWLDEGLIDVGLAETLRVRYPIGDQDTPWSRIIVSSVGAVVFGLGIILFFAYNWADMHKFVKLALVFGAVLAAHGTAFYLSSSGKAKRGLVESLHVMGTMLFGAGIWLVAQIYHIDEHYPNAFIIWGLGALALAWAMPSVAQALMAVLLVFLWECFEVFDFSSPNYLGPGIVLLGVLPLAWMQRSRVLLFFALVAFILLYAFGVGRVEGDLVLATLFYCACLYLAASGLSSRSAFPESAPVFGVVGYSVYLVLLYILSFREVAGELVGVSPESALEWSYLILPLVCALLGWLALLGTGAWQRADTIRRWEVGLILLAMLIVLIGLFGISRGEVGITTLVFNSVFLGHCVVLIVSGTDRLNWKQVSLGCVLFSALVFARFVDLFDSLLMRSLFFLALGAGLFLIGNFYSKRKKRREVAHA